MNHKLLFVDDERSLLNGIERRLGDDYDIITAESGDEGLAAIQEHGPFPTIFTDMRMPGMDGIEFAKQGCAVAPDSTFIMLTGNQDQTTAVQAINDGRVFRFLNKPCEYESLKRAADDGIEQYRLVTAEKELLQRTFKGAVAVLTDVISMSHSGLVGLGDAVERRLVFLATRLGIGEHWEHKLAARLSPLGLSLISDEDRDALFRSKQNSQSAVDTLVHSLDTTSQLVRDIPRLDVISEVFDAAKTSTGFIASLDPKKRSTVTSVGGALLRTSLHWEILSRQGLNNKECDAELRLVLPELLERIADCLRESEEHADLCCDSDDYVAVPPSQLAPGMITARSVCSGDGGILIRGGCRLTDAMIVKLTSISALQPVAITPATLPALQPASITG